MKETEDAIITPFVRKHLMNGYKMKRTKWGYDFKEVCPECFRQRLYTFVKNNFEYKKCPFCENCA
jgi:hypothetical protein